MRRPNNSFSRSGCTIALVALTALLFFPTTTCAGWVATLYDFDPDPSAEFANFFNPLNLPTGAPLQISAQVGLGTGGTDSLKYTPNGNSAGDQEFTVLPLNNGSLAGVADSLQQSVDFRFTHSDSRAGAGMGVGEDDSIVLLRAESIGIGKIRVSTFSQEAGTPVSSILAEPTPTSIQNWFRLAMTFTSSGNDVSIVGGLFDLGVSGTDTPSLVYAVNTTLSNVGVANGTGLSPGAHVASAQGDPLTDVVYLDNFTLVPEPTTIGLAAFGLIALAAWGWRQRKR